MEDAHKWLSRAASIEESNSELLLSMADTHALAREWDKAKGLYNRVNNQWQVRNLTEFYH